MNQLTQLAAGCDAFQRSNEAHTLQWELFAYSLFQRSLARSSCVISSATHLSLFFHIYLCSLHSLFVLAQKRKEKPRVSRLHAARASTAEAFPMRASPSVRFPRRCAPEHTSGRQKIISHAARNAPSRFLRSLCRRVFYCSTTRLRRFLRRHIEWYADSWRVKRNGGYQSKGDAVCSTSHPAVWLTSNVLSTWNNYYIYLWHICAIYF